MQTLKLNGKTAIITGGTSGIGRATAQLFAREGAKLTVVGRDKIKGESTLKMITQEGAQGIFVSADVSRSADVKRLVNETTDSFGRVDILVNNAGINPIGTTENTPEEVWEQTIAINLTGVFLCTKYVIPHMLKQGGGSIINVGSVNSFMALENEVAYDTSKGGVLMFTKATALDFARMNIRVNCICPGLIDTPLSRAVFESSPDPKAAKDFVVAKHPMKRAGTSEEVAKLALFLASDDSSFVTGTALTIDGGLLAGWPG